MAAIFWLSEWAYVLKIASLSQLRLHSFSLSVSHGKKKVVNGHFISYFSLTNTGAGLTNSGLNAGFDRVKKLTTYTTDINLIWNY